MIFFQLKLYYLLHFISTIKSIITRGVRIGDDLGAYTSPDLLLKTPVITTTKIPNVLKRFNFKFSTIQILRNCIMILIGPTKQIK